MIINWLRQCFRGRKTQEEDTLLKDIAFSLSALQQTVEEVNSGVQKGLRRLSLAQKQQTEQIENLAQESRSLAFNIVDRHGKSLTYSQALAILDHLHKIGNAADSADNDNAIIKTLQVEAATDLLSLFELKEIARIRQPYPDQGCEVVGAVDDCLGAEGTVHQILQQGYQTVDGQILRVAKVIVYRGLRQHQEISTSNNKEYG